MYTITIQNKKANLFRHFQYTKTKSYVKYFFDKMILLRKAVFIQENSTNRTHRTKFYNTIKYKII